jgi:hypothetical protein
VGEAQGAVVTLLERLREDEYQVVFRVRVQFEPRDLWLGLYWKRERLRGYLPPLWTFFICLVPMFPIVVQFRRSANA